MAELLKGAPVARALTEELAARCAALRERGAVPTLAIVRVGEREDDLSYERGALKRCEKVGIEARRVLLPADVSQDELLTAVEDINTDSAVHGCLMFRPLPAGLDENAVAAALDPAKDVDSMTPASLLTTLSGRGEGFAPCTAEAVLACWIITALSWMGPRLLCRTLTGNWPPRCRHAYGAQRNRDDVPYAYARSCRRVLCCRHCGCRRWTRAHDWRRCGLRGPGDYRCWH